MQDAQDSILIEHKDTVLWVTSDQHLAYPEWYYITCVISVYTDSVRVGIVALSIEGSSTLSFLEHSTTNVFI